MSSMLKYFRGDVYVNNLVNAVSECVSHIAAATMVRFLGLKRTCMVTYLISMAGMAGFLLTKTMD